MEEKSSFMWGVLDLSASSIAVGIVAALVLYKLMFKDFESFAESIKYWFMADNYSSREGMFSEEWWSEIKVFVWLGASIAIAFGANGFIG